MVSGLCFTSWVEKWFFPHYFVLAAREHFFASLVQAEPFSWECQSECVSIFQRSSGRRSQRASNTIHSGVTTTLQERPGGAKLSFLVQEAADHFSVTLPLIFLYISRKKYVKHPVWTLLVVSSHFFLLWVQFPTESNERNEIIRCVTVRVLSYTLHLGGKGEAAKNKGLLGPRASRRSSPTITFWTQNGDLWVVLYSI